MADRRVRVPSNREDIINKLVKSDSDNGPFNLRADLITFAAVIGLKEKRRIPFSESLEPIRQDVFNRHGYDTVINLIGVAETNDPMILANSEAEENKRITIFEEYANGGLEYLQNELRGAVDPLEHLLLLINQERKEESEDDEDEFGLSRFL